eukprot:CAMPEP_0178378412 /NCGR_PEP_ID=MMETSP0689_2-20121128/4415_1 /TAXON_ID=160604 /ORGANISM="Amphidinium massartii, Strain CS-259" /LENGTH=516 /DNA_ID=CAMNT_0019998485 /DNA_START=240 /DNA_END=1787 /DNA_ORIENTATION=-
MAQAQSESASPKIIPKGTPLDGELGNVSVMSYNLLAPLFVRPIDLRTGAVQPFAAFQWAEPANEVLDWEVRQPRLLAELKASGADVLCLQEVQFERLEGSEEFGLPSWLRELSEYEAELPSQTALQQMAERKQAGLNAEVAIGTAVLYKRSRLQQAGSSFSSTNTRVGACVRGVEGSQLTHLGPTVFFSVHLDATTEEKRVDQLLNCLDLARQVGSREVVIAGDMNTECLTGSCVASILADMPQPSAEDLARECASARRLGAEAEADDDEDEAEAAAAKAKLTSGSSKSDAKDKPIKAAKTTPAATASGADEPLEGVPTSEQLDEWQKLRQKVLDAVAAKRVSLGRVPTGATRASWDHGKDSGPCVSWRLDHIFFTPRSLRLDMAWETLESDPTSAEVGLPNRQCPSDHLPVAASFAPSPAPSLDAEAEAVLIARIGAMERSQLQAREDLEQEMAKVEPKIKSTDAASSSTAQEKGKKKGKEKPPPEVIAWIQEKRRRLRELKAAQLEERQALPQG